MNPHISAGRRNFFHFFLWQIGYYNEPALSPMPPEFVFPNALEPVDHSKPKATWVNHSTFWVEAFGKSILVDPIWNQRCSPVSFCGPARQIGPKPSLDQIHALDYVIISHNHYDHLDRKTIHRLYEMHPGLVLIVPIGVKKWFKRSLPHIPQKRIIELGWWESHREEGLRFTAVPAQHFSGRGLFDRDRSLWMGCVLEFSNGKRIYFAGDTGYNKFDFKEIGRRFGNMDLSFVPIGVYSPRRFMHPIHINPDEAIKIHQEVHSKLSIAGHWGTFRLSSEGLARPPYDLFCALEREALTPQEFRVLQPGQSINW